MGHIVGVCSKVGRLTSGVVAHKAKFVQTTIRVIGCFGRGAEPEIIIEPFRNRCFLPTGTRSCKVVLGDIRGDVFHFANTAIANQLARASNDRV
ncbi:hypothetical protein SDC9_182960 [bioreactor metagenome]|uniref:Uncharacterized protein n=1 Tax=bioreactor metagenome TaxID=1076179 RepID=A0A645HAS5_9ZZZZ